MEEEIINITENKEVVSITVIEAVELVTITVIEGYTDSTVLNTNLTGLAANPTRELPTATDKLLIFCKKVLKYLTDLGSAAFTNTEDYDAAGTAATAASNKVDKVTGSSLVADTEISKIHAPGSDAETATTIATIINGASADTILDADEFGFRNAVGAILKKITWTNFKLLLNSIYTRGNLTAEATERIVTTAAGSGGVANNSIQLYSLFITDSNLLSALITAGNWTGAVYTGITTGAVEGQLYVDNAYLYIFSNGSFTRYLQV